MSDAFDGAGKGFRDPSLRAALTMLLMLVLVVAGVFLAASWGLNREGGAFNTQINPPGLESLTPAS